VLGGLVAEADVKVSDGDVVSRQASVEPLGIARGSDDGPQSPGSSVKVVVSDEDDDDNSSKQQSVVIDGRHSVEKDSSVLRLKDSGGKALD